jgi:hypothetical protein
MLSEALPRLGHETSVIDDQALHFPARMQTWMREKLCALHGHDLMLHFEPGRRVYLRCTDCGHETPGWQTK